MKKNFQSSPFRDHYFGCMFEIQVKKMLAGALLYRRSVFKILQDPIRVLRIVYNLKWDLTGFYRIFK